MLPQGVYYAIRSTRLCLYPDPDVDADRTSSYEPAPVSEKISEIFLNIF